eukprot:UN09486
MDPDQQLHSFVVILGTVVFVSIIGWHVLGSMNRRLKE